MTYAFLASKLRDRSAEAILAYFQTRDSVSTFALRDDDQAGPDLVADVLRNRFTFNGESYDLPEGFDWTDNPSVDREWLILLHKFYFAVGLGEDYHRTGDRRYVDAWVELTSSWIEKTSLDFFPADVTARRVQNWVYAHHYLVGHANPPSIDPEFYVVFLESLQSQVRYLCDNLATKRNHRTMQLQAIFMAAVVFPEMEGAAGWLYFSIRELAVNLREDFLPDGVHCELSSDYHLLVVRNFLGIVELALLNEIELPHEMFPTLTKALDFALWLHKPDGDIPALSDGDSRSFREVLDQGYRLLGNEQLRHGATEGRKGVAPRARSRLFADSGYVIMRSGWGESEEYRDERYLVFDCGPLGEGNHGHLDLLSFEAAAYGRSVVVDPGRYTYYEPPRESGRTNWRAHFRGTASHNTVLVDGRDQTRYEFHKTRYKIRGPEPDHEVRRFVSEPGFDFVHGIARSHEYDVTHERKIFFARPGYWLVIDILAADEIHDYDVLFHLAPEAHGRATVGESGNTLTVDSPGLVLAHGPAGQGRAEIGPGFVSQTYGVKRSAPVVRFAHTESSTTFATAVYPFVGLRPRLEIEALQACSRDTGAPASGATAFRVAVDGPEGLVTDTFFSADTPGRYTVGEFACEGSLFTSSRRESDVVIHRADETTATMVGVAV